MLAAACGFYDMLTSIYSIRMQYAQLKFGWTAVDLGNLMSLSGVVRIIALLVVIPLLVKIVRRPHSEPVREGDPASSPSNSELAAQSAQSALTKKGDEDWNRHKAEHRIIHDYKFDLLLARVSLCIDISSYTAIIFTTTATHFLLCTVAQGLGAGGHPAMSSLCLMFADPKETGKLMGAVAVLQIMFSQILGPLFFNGVFAATVDTFPEAIFVLGTALYFVTLVFLVLVRVRRPKWKGNTASSEAGPEFNDVNAES